MKATTALTLAILCAGAITSHAAVVLSNLSLSADDSWPIVTGEYLAQSFRVGNEAASYSIDGLEVDLHASANTAAPLVFSIYTDSGNQPGTAVGQLTTGTAPTTAGVYSFTPTASIVLDSATTYWIVASTSGASRYDWSLSQSLGFSAQDTWSIDESDFTLAYSENAGTSWDVYAADGGIGPALFAISATPVPEPSAPALLLGAATVALTLRSRRTGWQK